MVRTKLTARRVYEKTRGYLTETMVKEKLAPS